MLFRVLPILHAPLRKFSTQAGAVADTALRLSTGEPNQRLTAVAISVEVTAETLYEAAVLG